MITDTKRALDNAIAEHARSHEEKPLIVTGYTLIVSYQTAAQIDDNETGYFLEYAEDQTLATSLGLTHMHTLTLDKQATIDWE